MLIAERTIEGLFASSPNRCAMPDCTAALVFGKTISGEICHIHASRKGGARCDAALMEEQHPRPTRYFSVVSQ